ncbi:hypothetical protein TNCV_1128681 [Trichonephila clavipes]|nr:hypothetical protein TNCV_1128681 [Trichonephila clavipes]
MNLVILNPNKVIRTTPELTLHSKSTLHTNVRTLSLDRCNELQPMYVADVSVAPGIVPMTRHCQPRVCGYDYSEFKKTERGEDHMWSSITHINNLTLLTSSKYNELNGQATLSEWTKTAPLKKSNAQPIGTRRKSRSNLRWIDGIEKDLLVLRTKNSSKKEADLEKASGKGQVPPWAVESLRKEGM